MHPIHREIKYSDGGYILPPDFVPLSYGSVGAKDVVTIESETVDKVEKNDQSKIDEEAAPEVLAEDFTGGGTSKTEVEQEEETAGGLSIGERKMNKPLAIGTIAGVMIILAAFGSMAGIIAAIIKKKKSHNDVYPINWTS